MRVKQASILNKAQKSNFSQSQIEALSREDVTVDLINKMFDYFVNQNKHKLDKDLTAQEAARCMDFIAKRRSTDAISSKNALLLCRYLLPSDPDTLIGEKQKFYLYHAFKFALKNGKMYEDDFSPFEFDTVKGMRIYTKLLYSRVNSKIANALMKYAMRKKEIGSLCYFIESSDLLIEDLVYNGTDSLCCILCGNNHLGDIVITHDELKRCYNADNHRFCFTRENIDSYFQTESSIFGSSYRYDSLGIAEREKDNYPIIDYVIGFCKENGLDPFSVSFEPSDTFKEWYIYKLKDESKLQTLQECFQMLQQEYRVDMPAWSLSIKLTPSFFVSITYKEYNYIFVNGAVNKNGWRTEECKYMAHLLLTPDGKLFRKHYDNCKHRTIPLTIVELMCFLRKDNLFSEFIEHIIHYHRPINRFIDDVIADCAECGCLLPITFNDAIQYYNRSHFLKSKYKLANELNVNWNKKNLNLSYLILKSYPKVDKGISQRILTQQKDIDLLSTCENAKKLDIKINNFLAEVLYAQVFEAEKREHDRRVAKVINQCKEELEAEMGTAILADEMKRWVDDKVTDELSCHRLRRDIFDYIRMCLTTKKKVRIDVKTRQQITNLHDNVAHGNTENHYRTHTQPVVVPKQSKFNKLRDILPAEFEWIKSRKRLILETELQHHCVWSYANKITEDRCAIYSFVDSDAKYATDGKAKRYTIEFDVDNDGRYSIIQVQGKYDREHTSGMTSFIQSILDKNQNVKTK